MKRRWDPEELIDHWTLLPDELNLVGNKTGATRLGFAILLKAFQLAGRFPNDKSDLPRSVIDYVANQVNVAADVFTRYEWAGRTARYHRAQIREFFGFREATVEDAEALVQWPGQARRDSMAVSSSSGPVSRYLFPRLLRRRVQPSDPAKDCTESKGSTVVFVEDTTCGVRYSI